MINDVKTAIRVAADIPEIYFGVHGWRVVISRATWEFLGEPLFVKCGADERERAFMVGRGEKGRGAKQVHLSVRHACDGREGIVINHTQRQVRELFDAFGWNYGGTYYTIGEYDASLGAIVFDLEGADKL